MRIISDLICKANYTQFWLGVGVVALIVAAVLIWELDQIRRQGRR